MIDGELERRIYASSAAYWLNRALFPVKMVVPQPLVRRIPGLTTNEDLRIGAALALAEGRLLDVGCGENRLARSYRARGGHAVGVDVHPWQGIDVLIDDASRLPFPEHSFDTVTFVACLNHIPDRAGALREARRVLAIGGQVVVSMLSPALSRIWHGWAFWDADQNERGVGPGELWGLTPAQVERLAADAGLRVVEHLRISFGLNHFYICRP